MDDKTAELRDIFLDVSGEETVTESQEDPRGSLASEAPVEDRLESVIRSMRERYDFRTGLEDATLVTVVRAFYARDDDLAIAAAVEEAAVDVDVDLDADAVREARYDLHLLREADVEASFDVEAVRDRLEAGDTPAEATARIAPTVAAERDTVRRVAEAMATREAIRAVGDRYRDEFEAILEDRDLRDRLAASVRDDGLEDATDGMETNVSF